MSKAKKSPKVQYGIEITKPWSKEMYDHNDMVSEEMKKNIINKWDELLKEFGELNMDTPWEIIPILLNFKKVFVILDMVQDLL